MPHQPAPFPAVPGAARLLRPVLPGLADETIAAIAAEVPDYARAMEGEFGQMVRLGVEVAFNRFVDLLADPEPDATESGRTYVDLGRGEFHAGRSLDALLAAYRVGARLAWRRFVEAGVAGGLSPDAIYALGEAIFAYIDELSAESAEGYAEEQTAAAGESERRRRRLVRLLAQHPPASQEAIRTAAAAAGWTLPRGGVAALVVAGAEDGEPGEAFLDSIAARFARRLGEGAVGAEAFGSSSRRTPSRTCSWRRHPTSPPISPPCASPRWPGWPRVRARAWRRRSPPGSTAPARCRPSPLRSACTHRPSAIASASSASCSASGSRL